MITLECDRLQQLCPNDDQQRMCVCSVTGLTLAWKTTSITGSSFIVAFGASSTVGANGSDNGFSGILTEKANGVFVSTLTFNLLIAGKGGVDVTCEDFASVNGDSSTTNIAVTPAGTIQCRYNTYGWFTM